MSAEAAPHHVQLLRDHLAGRRVVVLLDVLVASAAYATRLQELGVKEMLLVGGSRGTGEIDAEVEREAVVLGTAGDDLMGAIRAFEATVSDPPRELREAIDAFDPEGEALVITTMFSSRRQVCGREVFGAREPRWLELEDKTTVDAFWDAAEVPRAPSAIVASDLDELLRASEPLDRGLGTVWVADNREGWHGGGSGLRWVRTRADAQAAATHLAGIADVVRVMPFLEGRPCSIHGWVLGDDVIVSRPCETVMWREPMASRLWYGGAAATTWRPDEAAATQMRQIARKVGEHLREVVDYRGVFTVDGVLTEDGFRPSELNPRFGAAIATLGRDSGLPLYLLNCLSIDVPALDWRASELEEAIVGGQGWAAAFLMLDGLAVEQRSARVLRDGPGWCVEDARSEQDEPKEVEDEQPGVADERDVPGTQGEQPGGEDDPGSPPRAEVARVELGSGPTGAFLRIILADHPEGCPVAPAVAELLPVVGDHLGIELPRLEAAPDLR